MHLKILKIYGMICLILEKKIEIFWTYNMLNKFWKSKLLISSAFNIKYLIP